MLCEKLCELCVKLTFMTTSSGWVLWLPATFLTPRYFHKNPLKFAFPFLEGIHSHYAMMKRKQRREKPAQKDTRKAGIEEVGQKLETQNRAIRKILEQLALPGKAKKDHP